MIQGDLPAGWQWKTIGEVCRVVPGFAFKSKDWTSDGITVVKIKNIRSDCTVDVSEADCVPEAIVTEKLNKFRLGKGDILIAMTGATAGKVGWLSADGGFLLNQRVAKLEPVGINKLFFWGVVSGRRYQDLFFHLADGAAQPNMSGKQIEGVPIPVPPVALQETISGMVAAYDDLIETNTRRIAILEEMARRLYEEWFVHFRFPGHEEVEFDGDLPRGWHRVALGDLVEERRDAVNPETLDPETPYVGLEHIPRRSITMREWGSVSEVQSTKLRFIEDDILFGKIRPYFHKVAVAPLAGVASSDAIILRAFSPENLPLALCCASSDPFVDHATQTSNGTKMPRANWKVLSEYPVVLPDDRLLEQFNRFMIPLLQNLKMMNRKNANLRAQRDLLLPKLVSGEIDVGGAEAALEAAE